MTWTAQHPPFKVRCQDTPWWCTDCTPPKVTVGRVYSVTKTAIDPDEHVWYRIVPTDDGKEGNYLASHFVRLLKDEVVAEPAAPAALNSEPATKIFFVYGEDGRPEIHYGECTRDHKPVKVRFRKEISEDAAKLGIAELAKLFPVPSIGAPA